MIKVAKRFYKGKNNNKNLTMLDAIISTYKAVLVFFSFL